MSPLHPTQDGKTSPAQRVWRWLSAIVLLLSLGWVAWLLVEIWPELTTLMMQLDLTWLLAGLGCIIASGLLVFIPFIGLARTFGISRLPVLQVAHLYFTGQLLKHLPGRLWGVGYQWAAAGSAGSFKAWALSNIGHMLLAIFSALWIAGLVVAARDVPVTVLIGAPLGAVVFVGIYSALTTAAVRRALNWLPERVSRAIADAAAPLANTPIKHRLGFLVAFVLGAIWLYVGWWCFGMADATVTGSDAVRLCAIYMLAWFVGYVSFLTPSGLGVRELAFAWFAQQYGADVIALYALLGRASLLASDIVLGLIFAPFAPARSR